MYVQASAKATFFGPMSLLHFVDNVRDYLPRRLACCACAVLIYSTTTYSYSHPLQYEVHTYIHTIAHPQQDTGGPGCVPRVSPSPREEKEATEYPGHEPQSHSGLAWAPTTAYIESILGWRNARMQEALCFSLSPSIYYYSIRSPLFTSS